MLVLFMQIILVYRFMDMYKNENLPVYLFHLFN